MTSRCSRCYVSAKCEVECEKKCNFCRECMLRYLKTEYHSKKVHFTCPNNCGAIISLNTVKTILSNKQWADIAYRKRLALLNSTGIHSLDYCPLCSHVAVLFTEKGYFSCLNSICMKESCASCKGPAHHPHKCNEMGDLSVGLCNKCGSKFIPRNSQDDVLDYRTEVEVLMKLITEQIAEKKRNSSSQPNDRSWLDNFFSNYISDEAEMAIVLVGSFLTSYFVIKYFCKN